MALTDWIGVGFGAMNKPVSLFGMEFGGKFGVEIGTSVGGYILGRQTHILGQELKFVSDPESLYTPASTLGMAASAILLGATGKSELYYGRNMGSTYIGPKFDIKRASKSFEKRVDTHKGIGFFSSNAADPVDKAAAAACSAMALIINGVAVGLDIAAKIAYGDGKNPKDSFFLLKSLTISLTSRLMAFMELIEIKCGWVNAAAGFLKACKFLLKVVAVIVLVPFAILAGITDVITCGKAHAERAINTALNALENW